MIKSFTVKNFKAFRDSVTLDFSATGNYEFNTAAVKEGIVKTCLMYGKNAGGKSSLALALFDVVGNLTDNYTNPGNYKNYQNMFSPEEPVEFEYIFNFKNTDVVYKYKKNSSNLFIAETLIIDKRIVINYDKASSNKDFDIFLSGTESLNKDLPNLQISALKWIKSNSVLDDNIENHLFNELFDFVNKMLLFWSLDTRSFVGYTSNDNDKIIERVIKSNHFKELQFFFQEAGFTDELVYSNHSGSEEIYVKYDEKLLNFYSVCSTGMRSLLLVYYWLQDARNPARCPSFICIDEFDAFYHFELSRFIVRKLKELDCQVLLTTHNTTLFTNDLLRPDCFYICSKEKIINAHNATEKELRLGHNLEKLYRGGTFGK